MTLQRAGAIAGAITGITACVWMFARPLSFMVWKSWGRDLVASVVREEVADIRLDIADLATGLGAPDSTQLKIRLRHSFGPMPSN